MGARWPSGLNPSVTLGSIEIARPVREQLLPDHMTNHEMLRNCMVCMASWMQLVTTLPLIVA